MLLTATTRIVLCTVTAPVLLVGGCAEEGDLPSGQFEELVANAVRTHDRDVPSLGLSEDLYDPGRHTCAPTIDAPGDWRTQAPGRVVEEGPVELGVHGTQETGTTELVVTVIAPDGTRSAVESGFIADVWTRAVYPDDFPDAELESGVHGVIWSDGESRAPLACDGFEVDRR